MPTPRRPNRYQRPSARHRPKQGGCSSSALALPSAACPNRLIRVRSRSHIGLLYMCIFTYTAPYVYRERERERVCHSSAIALCQQTQYVWLTPIEQRLKNRTPHTSGDGLWAWQGLLSQPQKKSLCQNCWWAVKGTAPSDWVLAWASSFSVPDLCRAGTLSFNIP